jgi:hypothetical protein
MKNAFTFWKRKPKRHTSSLDDEIRLTLQNDGDDGTEPRHSLFYLYGGDLSGLEHAAKAAGYKVRAAQAGDGVILEDSISVDEESFLPVAKRMEGWAREFQSEYDGWECELLAKS